MKMCSSLGSYCKDKVQSQWMVMATIITIKINNNNLKIVMLQVSKYIFPAMSEGHWPILKHLKNWYDLFSPSFMEV